MNESVMTAVAPTAGVNDKERIRARPKFGAVHWYAMLSILIGTGWLLREREYINPEAGIGYWLGILGAVSMGALLVYPLRKRLRFLQILGNTRSWFRMHMILGLVGPLLILYHCNFHLGSFNSKVALYCMLLVAGSGIVGRHFYAAIHRGLYGRKTNLDELQTELASSIDKSHGLSTFMPTLVARLDGLANELKGDKLTRSIGVGRSLRWTFTHHIIRVSLYLTARRELRVAAATSDVVARDRKRLLRTASRYIRDYTRLAGRVAQFSFYERLFALWHVLHLPFFFMLVLSVLVHVLAVHMY